MFNSYDIDQGNLPSIDQFLLADLPLKIREKTINLVLQTLPTIEHVLKENESYVKFMLVSCLDEYRKKTTAVLCETTNRILIVIPKKVYGKMVFDDIRYAKFDSAFVDLMKTRSNNVGVLKVKTWKLKSDKFRRDEYFLDDFAREYMFNIINKDDISNDINPNILKDKINDYKQKLALGEITFEEYDFLVKDLHKA